MRKPLLGLFSLLLLVGCAKQDEKFLGSGTIEAREVTVSSKSAGQLLKLNVEEGDLVKRFQILGQIDSERLLAQKEDLDAKLAGLGVAFKRAEAQKSQVKESYLSAKQNYDRAKALYAQETVPKKSFDDSLTVERTARIQLEASDLPFDDIDVSRKQLLASRKLLDIGIKDAKIVAPLGGTVTKKFVEAGELVNPGSPICNLADLSNLWVKVYLDEHDLSKVRLNQTLKVSSGSRILNGKIIWISPKAEFTPKQVQTREVNATLVYAVKIDIPNPKSLFRIGMPVEVALP